jgi:hypothetical protein
LLLEQKNPKNFSKIKGKAIKFIRSIFLYIMRELESSTKHIRRYKEMLKDFFSDMENAKQAELLVRDTLAALTKDYTFVAIGDVKEYRYKGDIKAIDAAGNELFIEVKDDSRIADTGNILCEEENYIKDGDYYIKGNMHCDSDIYCIVS